MNNNRGVKIGNEYAHALGKDYADTPKAVYAALALSLAMRLSADNLDAAKALLADEWRILHENGIVPQKPPK